MSPNLPFQFPMFKRQFILVIQISRLHDVLRISISVHITFKRVSHIKFTGIMFFFIPLIPSTTYTKKQTDIFDKMIHTFIVLKYNIWNLYMVFLFIIFFSCLKLQLRLPPNRDMRQWVQRLDLTGD